EALSEKANYAVLVEIVEAIGSDELGAVRARLKDMFDKGGLGIRIVMGVDDEENARKLVETLERYGALEEYRRDNVRGAAFMKNPLLREPQAEPVYATAEMLEKKRTELTNLKTVEIPANSRALQAARERGDVRREVTILGPWESAPEHGVYSNQSDIAKALIGHAAGDIVSFMGNDYEIESIRRWNE